MLLGGCSPSWLKRSKPERALQLPVLPSAGFEACSDQMTSASTPPSSDPYDDFVAKVAELRERITVLEDEKMRMAFELKVRRAQTKVFPLLVANL